MTESEAAELIKEDGRLVQEFFPTAHMKDGVALPTAVPPLPTDFDVPAPELKENAHFHPVLQKALGMEAKKRAILDLGTAGSLSHSFNIKFLSLSGKAGQGRSPDFTKVAPGQALGAFGAMGFIEVERGGPDSNLSSDHQGQVLNYNLRLANVQVPICCSLLLPLRPPSQPGRTHVASVLTNLHKAMLIVTTFRRDAEPRTRRSPPLPVYRSVSGKREGCTGWALLWVFSRSTPQELGLASDAQRAVHQRRPQGQAAAVHSLHRKRAHVQSVRGQRRRPAGRCEGAARQRDGGARAGAAGEHGVVAQRESTYRQGAARAAGHLRRPDHRLASADLAHQGCVFALTICDRWLSEFMRAHIDQLTDTLLWMNTNKVQHRDLEPKHLAVTAEGSASILDFGFATIGGNKGSKPRSPGMHSFCRVLYAFDVQGPCGSPLMHDCRC